MFRIVVMLLASAFALAASARVVARAEPSSAFQTGPITAVVRWQALPLPVTIDGKPYLLDTVLAYLDDGARHPLVVFSNGSPRAGSDRLRMTPASDADRLLWFVRRGFTVASVLRRGYGRSGGGWAEAYGSCADPDYTDAGLRGAADIAASIDALRANPHVDASRVLGVGVSAGAFATIALTTSPPRGLVAAVAFAPGRGSVAPGSVCARDRLVAAFAHYGATSRVPVLWISARNDGFFGPTLVRRSVAAFEGAGRRATLFAAPADGAEGHYLFSSPDGLAIWGPVVDGFLARNGLALVRAPLGLAGPPATAPRGLGPRGLAAFDRYRLEPPHKAFASTPSGRFGYATGSRSAAEAAARAMEACSRATTAAPCVVRNVDGSALP